MRTSQIIFTCLLSCVAFWLSYIVAVAAVVAVDETAGVKKGFTFLVSGGDRSDRITNLSHYMVSIRTRAPRKYFGDNHFCSGAIIGENKILTAAHCVMDKRKVLTRPRRLLIVAGSKNRLKIEAHTIQLPVKSTVPHPSYVLNNTDDLAIIFLAENLPIGPNIKITPLPEVGPPYDNVVPCNVVGWGRMYPKGPLAAELVAANISLYTKEECQEKIPKHGYYEGIICAQSKGGDADPCRGDSGGPLVCNWTLTGIVSWTVGCGNRDTPSIYVDVHANLDWIHSVKDGAEMIMATLSFGATLLVFQLAL